MSLLSSLKRLVLGSPKTVQTTPPSSKTPHASSSRIPPVTKSVSMAATTDVNHIRVPQDTTDLAPGTKCDMLIAQRSNLKALPSDIEVRIRLDLTGSARLEMLPDGLDTGSLILDRCQSFRALPNGVNLVFLSAVDCASLEILPEDLKLRGGGLRLSGCSALTSLPDDIGEVAYLDLKDCKNLRTLPKGLTITSWIDITGTGIKELPDGLENVGLRRSGRPVSLEEVLA